MDNEIQPDHSTSTMQAGSEFPIGQPSGKEDLSNDDMPPDAMPLLPGSRFSREPPVLLPGLRMTGYIADEEESLRLLVQDQEFLHATNRLEQIAITGKYLRGFVGGRRMIFESIGRFFGVKPAIIQAQIELVKSSVGAPGRPALLSAAMKGLLENRICTGFEERKPINYAAVLDSLQKDHQVVLTADTLRHMIRHMESVQMIIDELMESEGVAVDPDEISAWFERLNSMVDGVSREFLFNMNETGCSAHVECREVPAIMPIDYGEPSISPPFDWHSKYSTFVAGTELRRFD